MSDFGDELIASAAQALAFAKGQAKADDFRVTPAADVDVKAIRAKLKLTQFQFADCFSIPLGTLRDWEQHRRSPDGAARVLLKIIEREPEAALRAVKAA